MTNYTAFPPLQASRFVDSKIAQFIETLKKIRFSGQLAWTAPKSGKQWIFYFCLGRIMYATGGNHPVRRWARNLAIYCPQMRVDFTLLQQDICQLEPTTFTISWEYQLLCLWVKQQKIHHKQAEQVIQSILSEVLFELSEAPGLTHQIKEDRTISEQLVLIDEKEAINLVQQLWQALWKAKITDYSLDKAPIIKQPRQLQQSTSEQVYQVLNQLLDGEKTLRDIAVQMKRDVVQVTRSLLPYIKLGLVQLISIPDLPAPVCQRVSRQPSAKAHHTIPLIACVDDSPSICQTMEKLLSAAGYRFISINEGLRALTILLARKPDLIFLDLVMPNTNGYEICTQLRKAPSFKNTPIVILTGNDGIVDQVRAKLVGASDFLSKPVDAGKVLSTISKHLPQHAVSPRGFD